MQKLKRVIFENEKAIKEILPKNKKKQSVSPDVLFSVYTCIVF